jgi:AcrR family transcriptional regulator
MRMNDSITAPVSKSDATRAAIIATAETLFRSMGYQKTAVADIARELRMSPANVYRFFASKTAINEAIAERLMAGMISLAWDIARGPEPAPERLTRVFTAMQEQTIALFFKEKRMHDMVTAAMAENWDAIERYVAAIDAVLAHIIADGQAAGVFDPTLAPDATGRLVHTTMIGFTHPTLIEQCMKDDDLPALAHGMAGFVLRSLAPVSK